MLSSRNLTTCCFFFSSFFLSAYLVFSRGNGSGDATLAVFDLRQKKLEGRVTNQEDELLSIQVVKVGPKLVLIIQPPLYSVKFQVDYSSTVSL